jgi:hypothetical protein
MDTRGNAGAGARIRREVRKRLRRKTKDPAARVIC